MTQEELEKLFEELRMIIIVTTYIEKSLLTSLCQREELSPLWKRGVMGDFVKSMYDCEETFYRDTFNSALQ